jgi:hypothetical protein
MLKGVGMVILDEGGGKTDMDLEEFLVVTFEEIAPLIGKDFGFKEEDVWNGCWEDVHFFVIQVSKKRTIASATVLKMLISLLERYGNSSADFHRLMFRCKIGRQSFVHRILVLLEKVQMGFKVHNRRCLLFERK